MGKTILSINEDRKSQLKHERSKVLRNMKRNWVLYLFMLPAFLWLLVFHYGPLYGVQIAFQKYIPGQIIGTSEWVGFKYFQQFFNSYWLPIIMRNTIVISLLNFVLTFPLPIVLALMLNEVTNTVFKKTVQTITYAPHFVSTVILCGMVRLLLAPDTGIIGSFVNSLRGAMGLDTINIMMKGEAFKWVYALSGVWQTMGWNSVIYFAALSAIDLEQVDAARIDGASKLQRIWYINMPVLKPTIVIQLILACGRLLSVGYEKVYLLQNTTIMSHSEVISTYVYNVGITGAQFSYSAAVGLFNNVVNAILLILVNTIVRKVDENLSLF